MGRRDFRSFRSPLAPASCRTRQSPDAFCTTRGRWRVGISTICSLPKQVLVLGEGQVRGSFSQNHLQQPALEEGATIEEIQPCAAPTDPSALGEGNRSL